MLAVIRGLRGERMLGDFYLDTLRGITLRAASVVSRLGDRPGGDRRADDVRGAVQASTLERGDQSIALGPVAAEVAIKQLGTNGGGFFGPNSAHPFENPSPGATSSRSISIIIIPMAAIVMFGRMIKDRAHATVIFGVMLALLLAGVGVAIYAELQPSAAVAGLPVRNDANLEGKEVRAGAGSVGHLVGDHDGDVERLGEFDARQFSAAGRPGADVAHDAQRRLQRHRSGLP